MVAFGEPDLIMHEKTQYINTINNSGLHPLKTNEIKNFYDDTVIFVTGKFKNLFIQHFDLFESDHLCSPFAGATGFLGKVMIEKLLRGCPGIKKIYMLLRPKRGQCSDERHREYVKNSIFDRIREKTPEVLDKLLYVAGDITQPLLGLNEIDLEKLYNTVNVVFHVAATVRFNESLLDAANLNTLGTQRVLELCEKMMTLKSVIHVSTAYSNPTLKNVGELVYPPASPLNHHEFIKCINTMPKDFVGLISDQLQGTHPNTYTITKSMAEQVVADYSHLLPICIVRPSIVTGSLHEPYPGWVDNVFGITGIMMEIGRGTISSIMCDEKYVMDLVPVDIVANTMITAGWANSFRQ
jgi:alcohol-forming fatty acyl-CoA reductase